MSDTIYLATIGQEANGAQRGKISNALAKHLGASAGDVVEFTVTGKEGKGQITTSRVLRGRNADQAKAAQKPVAKPATAKTPAKPAQTAAKTVKKTVAPVKSNRTTAVTMKTPAAAPVTVAPKKVVKRK